MRWFLGLHWAILQSAPYICIFPHSGYMPWSLCGPNIYGRDRTETLLNMSEEERCLYDALQSPCAAQDCIYSSPAWQTRFGALFKGTSALTLKYFTLPCLVMSLEVTRLETIEDTSVCWCQFCVCTKAEMFQWRSWGLRSRGDSLVLHSSIYFYFYLFYYFLTCPVLQFWNTVWLPWLPFSSFCVETQNPTCTLQE